MRVLSPVFNTNRMVAEYTERFYLRAHERHLKLAANNGQAVVPLVEWRRRLRDHGGEVRITHLSSEHASPLTVGARFQVDARIQLGGLSPDDIRVEVYYGRIDANSQFLDGIAQPMQHIEASGTEHLYRGTVVCRDSGSCGYSVRVVPSHPDAILPYEMPWIVWAE
jgi:starch phosphorylase